MSLDSAVINCWVFVTIVDVVQVYIVFVVGVCCNADF